MTNNQAPRLQKIIETQAETIRKLQRRVHTQEKLLMHLDERLADQKNTAETLREMLIAQLGSCPGTDILDKLPSCPGKSGCPDHTPS